MSVALMAAAVGNSRITVWAAIAVVIMTVTAMIPIPAAVISAITARRVVIDRVGDAA